MKIKKFILFLVLFLSLTLAKNVYTPVFAEDTVQSCNVSLA